MGKKNVILARKVPFGELIKQTDEDHGFNSHWLLSHSWPKHNRDTEWAPPATQTEGWLGLRKAVEKQSHYLKS